MCLIIGKRGLPEGFYGFYWQRLLEKRLCLVVGNLHSHLVRLRLLVDPVQLVILLVHLIIAIVGTIDDDRSPRRPCRSPCFASCRSWHPPVISI